MCSISTRPLAFKVAPDETRSTMRRQSPKLGASSMAPLSLMHSARTPRLAKWAVVILGYLVATRRRLQRLGSSLIPYVPRFRHRQAAMTDVQIQRRVNFRIIEFHQDLGPEIPSCAAP